jgi:cell division protein FtsN
MSGRRPLPTRDYKHGGRASGLDLSQYRQFGAGLAAGLVVALGVWLYDHRAIPAEQIEESVPRPRAADETQDAASADPAEDPATQFDFYDMLPKYEVVVSEQERDVRRDQPSVPVVQPGAYVVQAGSYRNQVEAARVRDKLVKQGIEATIQKVTVDEDEWFRVRVGPYRDLDRINATRRALRTADIDALIIRVGD